MRDIPLFTTENGAASLVFREIPYKGVAYVTIQDSLQPAALLKDCVAICNAAGADHIYATGHQYLEQYPLHTEIWQMSRCRDGLPESDAALFPVTEETIEYWRRIYNEKMKTIPNSATMTRADGQMHLQKGDGYFVHKDGRMLGMGITSGETVEAVIAVEPGAGETVLLTLCGALFSDRIQLEVSSDNQRAMRLYDKLGFVKTALLSRWFVVK